MATGNLLGHDQRRQIDYLQDLRVFQGVEDFNPFFTAKEYAGRNHHIQMARGVGLFLTYGGKNLADAALAIAQKVDDFEAGGLAKGFQDFCSQICSVHVTLHNMIV